MTHRHALAEVAAGVELGHALAGVIRIDQQLHRTRRADGETSREILRSFKTHPPHHRVDRALSSPNGRTPASQRGGMSPVGAAVVSGAAVQGERVARDPLVDPIPAWRPGTARPRWR
jgi:hypothetical protein